MIGPGLEGQSFNAYAYSFDTGLVGLITVTIEDSNGNVIVAPTTSDIIEIDVGGTSVYRWVSTFPAVGEYIVIWQDPDGIQAAEELVTVSTVPEAITTPAMGPCIDWITAADVADCCDIEIGSANEEDLDNAAAMASELLYRLTLKKFPGLCVKTVRPCRSGCGCDHVGEGWYWRGTDWFRTGIGRACGCGCVSQITLNGTVRGIVEVKIDGDLIAPDEYRVDEYRYLVRMADVDGHRQAWPRCQRLDLASTEPGTFEITYISGQDPPQIGISAAAALACELYRACPSGTGECKLPTGVTRIVRQGVTYEKVNALFELLRRGTTGLPLVDAFIGSYNPTGALIGPAIWSPDMPAHRRVG